jgi:hypothetical protein
MTRRSVLLIILTSMGFCSPLFAAVFQSSASLQGEQYASDEKATSRLDLNFSLISSRDPDDPSKSYSLPARELHFYSFYETGTGGDHSFDLDRTVLRFQVANQDSAQGHLWIGRTHPLIEATQGTSPTYLDAIGTNWAQNQSDALNPRVVGWVGVGGHIEDNNHAFSLTTAFSPLFLPSFGPRLQLSENEAAQGSRFSRLPPQFVEQGDATLPLRYKLDTGAIRNIVLQPQAYVSAGYANADMRIDVLDWTAPNPSPDVDTDFALVTHTSGAVENDSEDVMIEARPKFRRQHFTGFRYEANGISGKPLIAGTYEWFRKEYTASIQTTPIEYLSVGALNRWVPSASKPTSTATISPSISDGLVWAELRASFYHDRIMPSFHVEKHLSSGNLGHLLRPKINYSASSNFSLYAYAQVMRGQDRSYFGDWRSLGSAAMGVNWLW